jgi:hypothetical protein
MNINDLYVKQFEELSASADRMQPRRDQRFGYSIIGEQDWGTWITNALNLVELTFGEQSSITKMLAGVRIKFNLAFTGFEYARGVFNAAMENYKKGLFRSTDTRVSGEIFQSFIGLAKGALKNGSKDVAAVLVCASLEDALKRYAALNNLDVSEKDMTEVINALKGAGLVSGAQKTLLSVMPKIRDYAMHANWDKITATDVSSVIGFVEQFLLEYF